MPTSKAVRQNSIVEYVKQVRTVSSKQLSEQFHVTEETIRKDLQELSDKKKLIRTFGGASVAMESIEQTLDQRQIANYTLKQRIAREALQFVGNRDILSMDASSTTIVFAQMLLQHSGIVTIANSLEIINLFSEKNEILTLCTGGQLHTKSLSFQGIRAEEMIAACNITTAFLSCSGLDIERGIMDTNEGEMRVKQRMIKQARKVCLLMDSTKIGRLSPVTICTLREIDVLITDDGISAEDRQRIEDQGVQVVIAA